MGNGIYEYFDWRFSKADVGLGAPRPSEEEELFALIWSLLPRCLQLKYRNADRNQVLQAMTSLQG